jgi:hypothetical protein
MGVYYGASFPIEYQMVLSQSTVLGYTKPSIAVQNAQSQFITS